MYYAYRPACLHACTPPAYKIYSHYYLAVSLVAGCRAGAQACMSGRLHASILEPKATVLLRSFLRNNGALPE
jgi:hypothetical protein